MFLEADEISEIELNLSFKNVRCGEAGLATFLFGDSE